MSTSRARLFITRHAHQAPGYDLAAIETSLADVLPELLTAALAGVPERPGGPHVVLKPNWVREGDTRPGREREWEHVITHPAVIWGVARHVDRALRGRGRISICDAPQTDSSFRVLLDVCGLEAVMARHPLDHGTRVDVIDLRREEWISKDGVVVEKTTLPGDPLGYALFDLGERSRFLGVRTDNLYGADYDFAFTQQQHQGGRHRYLISRSVVDADLLIGLPKLKTHKKAGITCALKNMVGVNGDKNYLPHHRFGSIAHGGDEYPGDKKLGGIESQAIRAYKRVFRRLPGPLVDLVALPVKTLGRRVFGDTQAVVRSGNWHGNDTVWRMTLDLNQLLRWGRPDGGFRDVPRPVLVVVDGILGGEGEGPMSPDPRAGDLLLVADDPVVADHAAAAWMGFDPLRIPSIKHAYDDHGLRLTAVKPHDFVVESADPTCRGPLSQVIARHGKRFRAHSGWRGAIER